MMSDAYRELHALAVPHGGLGIPNLSELAEIKFENSKSITLPLVTVMVKIYLM